MRADRFVGAATWIGSLTALTPTAVIDWFSRPRTVLDAGFFWTTIPICLCGTAAVLACVLLDNGRRRRERQGEPVDPMLNVLQDPNIKVLADTPEGERR